MDPLNPQAERFEAVVWRWPTPKGILMVTVPAEVRPAALAAFGRTPVVATVRGKAWRTSIFGSKGHGAILLMPKKVLGGGGEGDVVEVSFVLDVARVLEMG